MKYSTLISKYFSLLYAPIDNSMQTLLEIDFKIDAQKISEVLASFKTLQKIYQSKKQDNIQLKLAFHDFNETYEYFDILLIHTWREYESVIGMKGFKNKSLAFIKSSLDLYGLKGGYYDNASKLLIKCISYCYYRMLSKFGRELSNDLLNDEKELTHETVSNVLNELYYTDINKDITSFLNENITKTCFFFALVNLYFAKKRKILMRFPEFIDDELVKGINFFGQLPRYQRFFYSVLTKQNVRPMCKEVLNFIWFTSYLELLKNILNNYKKVDDIDKIVPRNWNFEYLLK